MGSGREKTGLLVTGCPLSRPGQWPVEQVWRVGLRRYVLNSTFDCLHFAHNKSTQLMQQNVAKRLCFPSLYYNALDFSPRVERSSSSIEQPPHFFNLDLIIVV